MMAARILHVLSSLIVFNLALSESESREFSFRSHVVDGGKPILRGGVQMQPSQAFSDNSEPEPREPSWMTELRSRIRQLVARYGRRAADKRIQRAVHDIETARNVLMDVRGDSNINYKYTLREDEDAGVRLPDPLWLIDFKKYLRNLITKYGRVSLDEYVTPVVIAIEKANNVRINDIDVNSYGMCLQYLAKARHTHSYNSLLQHTLAGLMSSLP